MEVGETRSRLLVGAEPMRFETPSRRDRVLAHEMVIDTGLFVGH